MYIPENLETLLEEADSTIRTYLKKQGSLPFFSLRMDTEGDVSSVPATGEFAELSAGIGAMLGDILPLAREGHIIATAICSPIPAGVIQMEGWSAVMIDLEDNDSTRIYAVLPYCEHAYLGWKFGPVEYTRGKSQVFARAT